MANDPNKGSEFGGTSGRIQPPPHDPAESASETLGMVYATNPAGDTSQLVYTPDENDVLPPVTKLMRR